MVVVGVQVCAALPWHVCAPGCRILDVAHNAAFRGTGNAHQSITCTLRCCCLKCLFLCMPLCGSGKSLRLCLTVDVALSRTRAAPVSGRVRMSCLPAPVVCVRCGRRRGCRVYPGNPKPYINKSLPTCGCGQRDLESGKRWQACGRVKSREE